MVESVVVSHDFRAGLVEFLKGTVQAIGNGQLFEVQPEAFNRIEKWTVFRKPDHQKAIFKQAESGFDCFAVMVGGVNRQSPLDRFAV